MSAKKSTQQPKPQAAVATSESLEAQVAAFLNSGGEIQQIAKGVSGQSWSAPSRHIVIGKKAPELCPVCKHPRSFFQIKAENY